MLSSEVSVSLLNRAHRSSPYPGLGAIYVISVVSPDTFIARLNYYSVCGQCVESHSFCSSYFQNLVIPTTLIRSNICGVFFSTFSCMHLKSRQNSVLNDSNLQLCKQRGIIFLLDLFKKSESLLHPPPPLEAVPLSMA